MALTVTLRSSVIQVSLFGGKESNEGKKKTERASIWPFFVLARNSLSDEVIALGLYFFKIMGALRSLAKISNPTDSLFTTCIHGSYYN